jgi:UDP:flavonoid glycosyltransferase YjiC (YdhE family)
MACELLAVARPQAAFPTSERCGATAVHILLVTIGSAGDVHPFAGLGQALRGRGHRVTLVTNGYFEPLARRLGLEFEAVGTAEEYHAATTDPDLWHPSKGFETVARRGILPALRPVYEIIAGHYVPGETVVAASLIALGARLAQEKLGVPLATVALSPLVFRSAYQSPVLPGIPLPAWLPRPAKRFVYWLGDRRVIDPVLAEETNAFRRELGLPPVRRLLDRWWHSPQCALGLFPAWFARPQPDWPSQTCLTGFPLFDERDSAELPDEVKAFLDGGDPPVVFTPGSAMRHGQPFFAAAVAACQQLGRRGVLLTRFREQLPADLPTDVRHFEYLPFSQVLPRAATLVHHGGIGTTAQALAAGVPQLVMPMSHDQPDNAARLERLGVARVLAPRAFRAPAVARALGQLLASAEVASRCRSIAQRSHHGNVVEETCDVLERLVRQTPLPVPAIPTVQ